MPREVPTAAEVSVLDVDSSGHHLLSELALLTRPMVQKNLTILREYTRPQRSSDLAGVACIRLLAY